MGNVSVLAVCDRELLGKVLEEKDIYFEVRESFYKGKEIDAKKLKKLMGEFDNINIVGEKAVGVAVSGNFASEENVIRIKKVPHVQIFGI